jgi:hypothetical protein
MVCRQGGGLLLTWLEMRQILFLNQIPELPSERLASQTVCVAGGWVADPTPVAASSLFPPTNAIFCDYNGGIWGR